jgi:hypothetical protein
MSLEEVRPRGESSGLELSNPMIGADFLHGAPKSIEVEPTLPIEYPLEVSAIQYQEGVF